MSILVLHIYWPSQQSSPSLLFDLKKVGNIFLKTWSVFLQKCQKGHYYFLKKYTVALQKMKIVYFFRKIFSENIHSENVKSPIKKPVFLKFIMHFLPKTFFLITTFFGCQRKSFRDGTKENFDTCPRSEGLIITELCHFLWDQFINPTWK